MSVAPPPPEEGPPPAREGDSQEATANAEEEPPKGGLPGELVTAEEMLAEPFDDEFLGLVQGALEKSAERPDQGSTGGLAAPDPLAASPAEAGAPDAGSAGSTVGSPAGASPGGPAPSGDGDSSDFTPFLFGAGPAAAAVALSGTAGTATPEVVSALPAPGGGPTDAVPAPLTVSPPLPLPPPTLAPDFGSLPLAFEPNLGQADDGVQYLARAHGYQVFLGADGMTLALERPAADPAAAVQRDVVRLSFAGAGPVTLRGREELPGRSNYFRGGDTPLALTDVVQFGQAVARDLYPSVDLVYQGDGKDLRFDLVARPGADLAAIELAYQGAQGITLDADGRLVLHTPGGDLVQHAPVLFQDIAGTREAVAGRCVLRGPDRVGFQVDACDASAPLVIDPTLSFSSYLGGSGADYAYAVAVDLQGRCT